MRILWIKTDFLHPTTRGGQIRSLETLRRLHQRHEVDYVCFNDGMNPEGPGRAHEYCTRFHAVSHRVPEKSSAGFALQLAQGLVSPLPVAVFRWRSELMRRKAEELTRKERFDSIVCDFLFPAPNVPDLSSCILFQHNVESRIWLRHAENAPDPLRRSYLALQARRMAAYEGDVCRAVLRVIAVSEQDAECMRSLYGVNSVYAVPTGVDIDYFARRREFPPSSDLVFVGSMDWMPNIDGMQWFVREVLPLIRRRRPDCSLAIVGRKPTSEIVALAAADPHIQVTGTVPDVRPWMFGASVAIVPLRVGGGTRLKIYEAMAARLPVVSTTVGAEGLDISPGDNIEIADRREAFAQHCVDLLDDARRRERLAQAAWELVSSRYSWDAVAHRFEALLM
jgi:sugar transferase (PEP-CTERM/EpsH1 system associated)